MENNHMADSGYKVKKIDNFKLRDLSQQRKAEVNITAKWPFSLLPSSNGHGFWKALDRVQKARIRLSENTTLPILYNAFQFFFKLFQLKWFAKVILQKKEKA